MQPLTSGDPIRVGPYTLVGRLGAGGMGRVYLGRSPGGRAVAVKVIRPELADDAEFRNRFAREVAAARAVSGVYTAPVIDSDPTADHPWLATAYVPGLSLTEAVRRAGPLPEGSVKALAAGLAEALAAVHAAGLVHRDLKPSNVLLAPDGPKVIDFGIARAADATGLTQTGFILGSPGFMAPEQITSGEIGPPSDVFAFGALIVFAATGREPFGRGPAPALVYRLVHSEPALDGIAGDLRELVAECLAKDPAVRPTAATILTRLTGQDQETTLLPGPGWLPPSMVDALLAHATTTPAADPSGVDQPSPPMPSPPMPDAAGGPDANPGPGDRTHVRAAARHNPQAARPETSDIPDIPVDVLPTFRPGRPGQQAAGPAASGTRRKRVTRLMVGATALAAVVATVGVGLAAATGGPGPRPAAGNARPANAVPPSTDTGTAPAAGPAASAPSVAPPAPDTLAEGGSEPAAGGGGGPDRPPGRATSRTFAERGTSAPPQPLTTTSRSPAAHTFSFTGNLGRYSCADEGHLSSARTTDGVQVTFYNQSPGTVKVYWLDFEGSRVAYDPSLEPGSAYASNTYVNHLWLIADAAGGCLGIFTAGGSGGSITIH